MPAPICKAIFSIIDKNLEQNLGNVHKILAVKVTLCGNVFAAGKTRPEPLF